MKVTINQFVPSMHVYDAVGSTALVMDKLFRDLGYSSRIYALYRDPVLARHVRLFRKDNSPEVSKNINILHFALPSPLTEFFAQCGGKRIIVYHNITPPHFFRGYEDELAEFTTFGLSEIASLVDENVRTVAYSEFSARDLRAMGYSDPVVLPFLLDWRQYGPAENPVVKKMLSDGWTNILFVGRLVPNKRQDDLIRLLTVYRAYFNRKTRLVLVGKGREGDTFHHELLHLIREWGDQPVLITGRVTPQDIVTYYRNSHAFVSMSEHEGFCVPLIEAMYFQLPILAYKSAAIPDTLGGAGLLVDTKDYEYAAAVLDRLLTDETFRTTVLSSQRRRLKDFQTEKAVPLWEKYIRNLSFQQL